MRELRGKVAWVTGAGSGIGESAAVALAAAGMHVVLSGRSADKLEAAADRTGSGEVLPLDVADKLAVQHAVDSIVDRYGRLDVLVSSAGINVPKRNWHEVSAEDWDRVIRIDLDGAFYCARAVLPHMINQRDGLIVNVSSWAGRHVSVLTGPAYTAAKHAMIAMNESINMEAGIHGVRACALCPGEVATPILDSRPHPPSAEERARMVQPDDCGEVIRFLAALPAHVCINELTISPTWNRGYARDALALR
ncbi:MAG: SDR family oxidoreductase [Pseudomonadales bacterium]|nr:SDR family oxidoreductase [Pseudomonadales bacterium]MCP5185965.1 SDR family oxidoreductase [Pseudomonadales bacterium]